MGGRELVIEEHCTTSLNHWGLGIRFAFWISPILLWTIDCLILWPRSRIWSWSRVIIDGNYWV
jgi:hypothetical protein